MNNKTRQLLERYKSSIDNSQSDINLYDDIKAALAKPVQEPIKETDLDDIYVDVLGINALDDTECKIVLKIARLIETHHGIGVKV
jgi:hypothetical protein